MRNIKIFIILALGIMLRVFLSAITYHPDLQVFNIAGKILGDGNIFNLYDYLPNLAKDDALRNLVVLNYPPAIYLFHGIFNFIFSTVFGLSFINDFILDQSLNYGNIFFNLHLIFLKLPYMIFDISCAFLLFKLFKDKRQSLLAFSFWIFNPINLYSTYMMGQFDIIPTLFTILAIYLIEKNEIYLASLSLGGGIAFKIYPVFLIIPLLILKSGVGGKLKLLILSFLPYILTIIPYLHSHNFRSTALFANQNTKSLYANLPISGGESILIFPLVLIFFYLVIWKIRNVDFWKISLIILLLFFIFTHTHPQWLIWVTPFLIIELAKNQCKNIHLVLLIFFSFIASLFFFDSSLTVNLFAPLFPFLKDLPSIWKILNLNPDYNLARSLIQTIFSASALFLIYQYFPKKIDD